MYENYFYLKQVSDYVTTTEFVSAPIFKSIDPSISRNILRSERTKLHVCEGFAPEETPSCHYNGFENKLLHAVLLFALEKTRGHIV